jgi:hypothetical protein
VRKDGPVNLLYTPELPEALSSFELSKTIRGKKRDEKINNGIGTTSLSTSTVVVLVFLHWMTNHPEA